MVLSELDSDTLGDINDVSMGQPHLLKNSSGQTVRKDPGLLDGLLMSRAVKWLTEVRSFEMSVANILLSAIIFSILFGIAVGVRMDRSRNDSFYLNSKKYGMVGLAEVPNQKGLYLPVYKETSQ